MAGLTSEGKDLRFFAREMAGYLRGLLLEKITPGSAAREAWGDPAVITGRAAEFSMEGLLRAVELMADTEQEMKWSSQPGIILELALVKACRAAMITSESSLLARLEAVEEKLQMLGRALSEKTAATPKPAPRAGKPGGEYALPDLCKQAYRETNKKPAERGETISAGGR